MVETRPEEAALLAEFKRIQDEPATTSRPKRIKRRKLKSIRHQIANLRREHERKALEAHWQVCPDVRTRLLTKRAYLRGY